MVDSKRLMLIASPIMHRTPAFDRAGALAKAMDAPLHIVAFDYVDGLATAGLVNEKALAEMREGYVSVIGNGWRSRLRVFAERACRSPLRWCGSCVHSRKSWCTSVSLIPRW